jgi:hypothetical protein
VDTDDSSVLDSDLIWMVAWVFPSQLNAAAASNIIMNKENVYEYGLGGDGRLQGAFSPCWRWWGTAVLPLDEWTHAVAGIDGASEVHYVNGERMESTVCAGVLIQNDDDFKIGARGGDGAHGGHFHGSLDDVMLFEGALTDGDMLTIYQACSLNENGPVSESYDCAAGLWCPLEHCYRSSDCVGTSSIPCGDINSGAEAIDRSCPDTADGEMVPAVCPAPCAAAFLPWWEGCGTAAALLDALPASVTDQLSAFYASCGGEDTTTKPVGPSKTPCSANVDCAARGENIGKFCPQALVGRPQTCASCADCVRGGLDTDGAECKIFCRADEKAPPGGGH